MLGIKSRGIMFIIRLIKQGGTMPITLYVWLVVWTYDACRDLTEEVFEANKSLHNKQNCILNCGLCCIVVSVVHLMVRLYPPS